MTVTQKLRAALKDRIDTTDETLYSIAKKTGMQWNTLKRFYAGEPNTGFRSDRLDKLADYLELDLTPRPKARKKS